MSVQSSIANPVAGVISKTALRGKIGSRLTAAASVEFFLILICFEPFLKEFRLRLGPPWLAEGVSLGLFLMGAAYVRRKGWHWGMRAIPTLAVALFLNWASAVYSNSNWPIDRKAAGYLAVWFLYFFHMLSLYAVTWIPWIRYRGSRGLWMHWILVVALEAFLVADYEYFRLSGNHINAGYVRLFFERDSFAHMGVEKYFWLAPVWKILAMAGASALLPIIDSRRRRAA